jgi:hypothetical protein
MPASFPPRSGTQRLIPAFEYRHLRGLGFARLIGGSVAAVVGVACLWYGGYGWAAFFLVLGALLLLVGNWYLAIARHKTARA